MTSSIYHQHYYMINFRSLYIQHKFVFHLNLTKFFYTSIYSLQQTNNDNKLVTLTQQRPVTQYRTS